MNVPESIESRNELLAGYVLGDLSPEEAATVEQQLQDNPDLVADLEHLQTTMSLMAVETPAVSPPLGLRDRILTQVTEPAPAPAPAAVQRPMSNGRGKVLPFRIGTRELLTGAAALALALLGISNFQMQQRLASVEQEFTDYQEAIALLQNPQNRLLSIQSVSDTMSSQGMGSLVIAPEQDAAILTLQNIEPPPEGMVYRMWAYVDGEKVDCADFVPDASGDVFMQFPLTGWEGASSVVVNIEPEGVEMPDDSDMVLMGETL
ncbi:anti-sigma factor domain-containing protein [Vacuolonema iberomarrocanum]|uniref:anti-sigma factor n=1 Tax=Vacuolonema iberomarrocanum TaxID=3454632 RepID=UPI0019EF9C08|nr:anti-sigma factor [filamentous cyanobacterium LEGE 07170]